jgi:hypothetical protein
VLYAGEQLAQRLTDQEYALVDRLQDQLTDYCAKRIWLSTPDREAASRFRDALGEDLVLFCRLLARSEKVVYDKRAQTLKEAHPLALQVNLDTGVANTAFWSCGRSPTVQRCCGVSCCPAWDSPSRRRTGCGAFENGSAAASTGL